VISAISLRLLQANHATLKGVVYEDTEPPRTTRQDLTAVTDITLMIKAARETPDGQGTTLTLDGAITITDAERGELEIEVPAALVQDAGERWFRLDLTQGGEVTTAAMGYLQTIDT
jgi:hypothetical protein